MIIPDDSHGIGQPEALSTKHSYDYFSSYKNTQFSQMHGV
ncbi:hypothetical protein B834_891 [Enterococcus mundtii 1A]|nr:hypothetical protein [Enterococcus mundtii 1A]